MKKATSILAVLALCTLVAAPALAGGDQGNGKPVELSGWIVDKDCGANNAGAEHKDCILACNKKGAPLVLAAGDKIYALKDQKGALAHVGHEVVVKGTVDEGGAIKVTSIEKKG